MEKVSRLVGRDDAIVLIRAYMDRPQVNGRRSSQPRPTLILEGSRGSGKSALLDVMSTLLEQKVPWAVLDFESERSAGIPDVLSALAFQLSRSCRGYGSISFPRLAIARLMMARPLEGDDHAIAKRQVSELLAKGRRPESIRLILEQGAGVLAGVLAGVAEQRLHLPAEVREPVTTMTKSLPKGLLTSLPGWGPGRKILFGPYQEWFGHRDRGLKNNSLDVLVDLNRFAQDPLLGNNQQWVHELLWDAFLTDLCSHFAEARRGAEPALNCVVLLDNADTRIGQEFVAGLVQARIDRPGRPDPLTAVLTSRGDLLVDVPDADVVEYPPGDSPERLAEYRTARFRLPDLSLTDTRSMVMALGLRGGNTTRSVQLVHQFTDGHPASTRILVSALGRHPKNRDSLLNLLIQAEPGLGSGRARVSDAMLGHLLVGFPPEALPDLVTGCAATHEQHLRSMVDVLDGGENSFRLISSLLWPSVGGAGPHVLRRLLLLQLAQRAPGANDWQQVLHRHRQARAEADDIAGELTYALAEGDLGFVVERLAQDLTTMPVNRWHRLLLRVCQAPHRHPDSRATPHDEMLTMLHDHPNTGHPEIARLVVASWIVADPLTDSFRGSLYLQMAADCTAVARECRQDNTDPLLRAAREYARQGEVWN